MLAEQRPTDADLVIGVPDSAIAAATGFAEAAGLPYADGFVRNRYIGRTFIEPTQRLRKLGARLKYNPLPDVVRGKRIVLLDDTIVRGTTPAAAGGHAARGRRRDRGPRPHHRTAGALALFPGHRHPLTPTSSSPMPQWSRRCACASAPTASSTSRPENLTDAIAIGSQNLCLGCFTRDYPIDVQLPLDKFALERPIGLADRHGLPGDPCRRDARVERGSRQAGH